MGNKLSYPDEDLSGKVVVVTGGNTGIGYETAKGLVKLGAHTFIACRSKERAEAAIECIKSELDAQSKADEAKAKNKKSEAVEAGAETGTTDAASAEKEIKLEYLPLDLSSFQSTKDFVHAFKEKNLPLHILINNAALCAVPYRKTDDGYESQFQVNHLSHMLLTLELLPIVLETAASSGDGRIIFVSSYGHYLAPSFNPEKLSASEEEYKRLATYNSSKLYNVMTSFELQRRLQKKNITVSSLHPGYVQTELSRGIQDMKVLAFIQNVSSKVVGRKPLEGAATTLNCAVNPDLNSQQHFYYDSCRPKEPSADSRNKAFQEQLWAKSFEFLKDHLSPETVEKYGPRKREDQVESQPEDQPPPPSTESKPEDQPPLSSTESKLEDQPPPPSTEEQAEDKPEDQPLPPSTESKPEDQPPPPSTESKAEDQPPPSSTESKPEDQPPPPSSEEQAEDKPEDQPPPPSTEEQAEDKPEGQPPPPSTEQQAEGKPENQPLDESRSSDQQEDSKPEANTDQ